MLAPSLALIGHKYTWGCLPSAQTGELHRLALPLLCGGTRVAWVWGPEGGLLDLT